jgi:hypothetical protein
MSIEITREEILILLELAVQDAPASTLELGSNARWQADHDEFSRRLAALLTEAFNTAGFAWAKLPMMATTSIAHLFPHRIASAEHIGWGSRRRMPTCARPRVM